MARTTSTDSTASTTTGKDPNEQIVMVHKGTGGRQTVTRRQLEEVWVDNGWTEDTDSDPNAVAAEHEQIAATVAKTPEG